MFMKILAPSGRQMLKLSSFSGQASSMQSLAFPVQAPCHTPSRSGSSFCCSQEGVYELRTYSIVPSKMAEFLQLMKEQFHLRTSHSQLVGFWTSEIGGLNQVVHIWYYGNLSERAGVRQNLAKDPEWYSKFLSKALPTWDLQENSLLQPLEKMPIQTTDRTGVYELETLSMSVTPSSWKPLLQSYAIAKGSAAPQQSPLLVGAWQSTIGRLNYAVLLWQHDNVDGLVNETPDIGKHKAELFEAVQEWNTKLLLPHAVSPLG